MELALLISSAFNLFMTVFLVYLGRSYRSDLRRKDRMLDDLTLKYLCKDVGEYLSATPQKKEERVEEEVDNYVPVDEVPFEKLEGAKDEL